MNQNYHLSDIKRTLRAKEVKFRKYPNVLHLTIGEKRRGNSGLGYRAIRVFVSKKVGGLPRGEKLPARIRGVNLDGSPANYWIPIDVQEQTGKLSALALKGGDRIRRVMRGAVGLVYMSMSDRRFVITNAHVLARPEMRPFGRRVKKGAKTVGSVHRMSILRSQRSNTMDAALVELDDDESAELLSLKGQSKSVAQVGKFSSLTSAKYFYVTKRGFKKRFESPNPVKDKEIVEINGVDLIFRDFWKLTQVSGSPLEEGDSGSVLVREDGNSLTAVGIVFAGVGSIVAAFSLFKALTFLGTEEASDNSETENVDIDFGMLS